jgi:hypothetical protein
VKLAKPMESVPLARPKREKETEKQKSPVWDEEERFGTKIPCFRSYSISCSSLMCLIGIGGCKSGLLRIDRIVGTL